MNNVICDSKFLKCLSSIWSKSEMQDLADHLLNIAAYQRCVGEVFRNLLELEFNQQAQEGEAAGFLRSNNLISKCLDVLMDHVGSFMSVLAPLVQHTVSQPESFEIDPDRLSQPPSPDILKENTERLQSETELYVETLMEKIKNVLPIELRKVISEIKNLAQEKGLEPSPLIGSLLMLRIINPSIASPERYQLASGVSASSRRALLLVSKVLQKMSNNQTFDDKEAYMSTMNPVLFTYQHRFQDWLQSLADDIVNSCPTWIPTIQQVENSLWALRNIILEKWYYLLRQMDTLYPFEDNQKHLRALLMLVAGTLPLSTTTTQEAPNSYGDYLTRASFLPMEQLNWPIVQVAGVNMDGILVVQLFLHRLPSDKQLQEDALAAAFIQMDALVSLPYILVYCCNRSPEQTEGSGVPSIRRIIDLYTHVLPRKYKKNIVGLYALHPPYWVKTIFTMMRPIISTKFWRKLHYCRDMESLLSSVRMARENFPLPYEAFIFEVNGSYKEPSEVIAKLPPADPQTKLFGAQLSSTSYRSSIIPYPTAVQHWIQYLRLEAVNLEGVFRTPPPKHELIVVRALLDRGYTPSYSHFKSIHTVCGLLKLYLRLIPGGGLFGRQRDIILQCTAHDPCETDIRSALLMLPSSNYQLAKDVFTLLKLLTMHEEQNKMSPQNLATCLSLSVFPSESETEAGADDESNFGLQTALKEQQAASRACLFCIEHYNSVFELRKTRPLPPHAPFSPCGSPVPASWSCSKLDDKKLSNSNES